MQLRPRHKYGAKAVVIDGYRFASQAEARRYQELRLLERAGVICGLELQPGFPLEVNGIYLGYYQADFCYFKGSERVVGSERVIEDVKGIQTPVYRLKKKLMWALYAIEVQEVP